MQQTHKHSKQTWGSACCCRLNTTAEDLIRCLLSNLIVTLKLGISKSRVGLRTALMSIHTFSVSVKFRDRRARQAMTRGHVKSSPVLALEVIGSRLMRGCERRAPKSRPRSTNFSAILVNDRSLNDAAEPIAEQADGSGDEGLFNAHYMQP